MCPPRGGPTRACSWVGATAVNMAMRLRLCRTFWGVDDALDPAKWDALFASVAAQGYAVRRLCACVHARVRM